MSLSNLLRKIISAERKRPVIASSVCIFKISERKTCLIFDQHRSTQRYKKKISKEELELRDRIIDLASHFGHFGYRRITALLNRERRKVNPKRVERIWRAEGLQVSQKQPKRGLR